MRLFSFDFNNRLTRGRSFVIIAISGVLVHHHHHQLRFFIKAESDCHDLEEDTANNNRKGYIWNSWQNLFSTFCESAAPHSSGKSLSHSLSHSCPNLRDVVPLCDNNDGNDDTCSLEMFFKTLKTNEWRGNEAPMFDEDVEMEGCKSIYESLTREEMCQLSDLNMPLRHFRAEKGDVKKAITKLKSTLLWRREFGVTRICHCFDGDSDGDDDDDDDGENEDANTLLPPTRGRRRLREMMERENETGKIFVRGYNRDGRAILFILPHLENTRDADGNMVHLVYNMERAIACTHQRSRALAGAGGVARRKFILVLDLTQWSVWNAPSLPTSKRTLSILQDHYPETIYRIYVYNAPAVFQVFWKLVHPFVNPVTKAKIQFCQSPHGLEEFNIYEPDHILNGCDNKKPFNSKEYLNGPFEQTFDE